MKVRFAPLILGLVLGTLAVPLAAEAQQAGKVFRVGWLGPFDVAAESQAPFVRELRELGYVQGGNLRLEVRKADRKPERLPELAAALARALGLTIPPSVRLRADQVIEEGWCRSGTRSGCSRLGPHVSLIFSAVQELGRRRVLIRGETKTTPWTNT